MSTGESKATLQRYSEAIFNKLNLDIVAEFVATTLVASSLWRFASDRGASLTRPINYRSSNLSPDQVRWPPILCYHAIARVEDDPNNICVSPEQFEAQMLYLKRRNLRGVSVRELLRAIETGNTRGLVGITFDDAYENFLQTALPVLERFGFSSTVFAPRGTLGGENSWDSRPRMKLLGADGLREVSKRGMEVGSHSISHIKLPGLEPELLKREISGSRQILSEMLGEKVEGFCYPYGHWDDRALQAVQVAGYNYACSLLGGKPRGVYDMPRIPVFERDKAFMLQLKLWAFSQYVKIIYSPYAKMVYALIRLAPIRKRALKFWYHYR